MADTITHRSCDPASTSSLHYVFVYGTLRRGEQRDINLLLPAPFFIGYGKVPGVLYHLGTYPGLRLGGSQFVHGEVYRIKPKLERQLDEIEEVWPQQTGEYNRQEVRVEFTGLSVGYGPDSGQTCLVYEVADKRTSGMPVIASGDWLRRQL